MSEAYDKFTHIVVALASPVAGVGAVYTVGTLQECRLWQLAQGMRACTKIIPF